MNLLKLLGFGLFMFLASYPSEVQAHDVDNLDIVLVENAVDAPIFCENFEVKRLTSLDLTHPDGIQFIPIASESQLFTSISYDLLYKQKIPDGIRPNLTGSGSSSVLYQNAPNPFSHSTTIKVYVPETQRIQIKVFDINGADILTQSRRLHKGENFIKLESSALERRGLLHYQVVTKDRVLTRTMLAINDNIRSSG